MFTAPSSNNNLSSGKSNVPSDELKTFFSETVEAYRSGTEKEKVWLLHAVLNKIEEVNARRSCSFVFLPSSSSLLFRLLSSFIFVPAVCVIGEAECGVECADSGCGVCVASKAEEDERPASLAPLSHPLPATHAVGLVCDSSLSCGEVEGVLSGGVVEKVCSWVEGATEIGIVLGLLRVVEKLCVGLKGALRSAQKQEKEQKEKKKKKVKSGKEQGHAEQKEEESRDEWSLASRCQSALDLMGNTLLGWCSAQDSDETENSVKVMAQAREILAVHFPHAKTGERKEVGVIGVDLGLEMRAMEERERRREEEMKKKEEELDRREEERRKEHELKMAELNEQAERFKRFIEEGEERERRKEEKRRKHTEMMKRLSKVGAAAIEWFPADAYDVSGPVFTCTDTTGFPTLLSAEFGKIVVRFTFTFQNITGWNRIGIVASAQTGKVKGGSDFSRFVSGAGWDMDSENRFAIQHKKIVQSGSACVGGRGGQRVVLEADGRDGKRTLRLSQDGQTQPTFFSNIPVPFRFAIVLNGVNDAVSIESVEVVAEPQLITPEYQSAFTFNQILFELVPARDGSCSGFAECLVLLLTSANEALVQSKEATFEGPLRGDLYRQFFICSHRRRIADTGDSHSFSTLDGTIFTYSLFLGQMTEFVLSSPLALASMDCVVISETGSLTVALLWNVMKYFGAWKEDDASVEKRKQRIVAKLREEGISDVIELHIKRKYDYRFRNLRIFLGAKLIDQLGGNAPL
ncbi:hypothetical protein BLNAU_15376 [Blattamonas nauphoetae]|uniref:Uncharacterized protein n=1 Tax=Blattamonas nauphoetae TaxID=2049346 RepID=A0ABQ9XHN9_9EUKA|nr:hypothetical protein BLNAU_15376 [Blattamonas nauphoetae]